MPEVVESYHDLVRREVFGVIPDKAGRVLDIGGGIGATVAALKSEGRASFVAVADMVGHALPTIDRTYSGNLEDESFIDRVIDESGPFDTILCLDVLEHLRDPWSVVRWLGKGLAPNGVIVGSIPNVNYIELIGPLVLSGRYELKDKGILDRTHIRWFAKSGAVALMTQEGLMLEMIEGSVPGRKFRMPDKLSLGLLRRFFVLQYFIRVRLVNGSRAGSSGG